MLRGAASGRRYRQSNAIWTTLQRPAFSFSVCTYPGEPLALCKPHPTCPLLGFGVVHVKTQLKIKRPRHAKHDCLFPHRFRAIAERSLGLVVAPHAVALDILQGNVDVRGACLQGPTRHHYHLDLVPLLRGIRTCHAAGSRNPACRPLWRTPHPPRFRRSYARPRQAFEPRDSHVIIWTRVPGLVCLVLLLLSLLLQRFNIFGSPGFPKSETPVCRSFSAINCFEGSVDNALGAMSLQ